LSNVDIPQTDAILVRREAASMRPGGRRLDEVAAVAAADPPKLVRTASHRVVMNRIDRGADATTVTSVHRIETTAIGR
jgi:hypothetical protein